MRRGFSLIEVTLALMVVAVGLLAVFNLFPSGLRASVDATAETRVANFADEVLSALRAEAAKQTNSTEWIAVFGQNLDVGLSDPIRPDGNQYSLKYPADQQAGAEEWIRYSLTTSVLPGDLLTTAELKAWYGKSGGFEYQFYTEYYNYGM